MRTVPLGISVPPVVARAATTGTTALSLNSHSKKPGLSFNCRLSRPSSDHFFLSHLPTSGFVCRASQIVELFPTVSPSIVVREARLEDSWEVAETHCSSFFPEYSFPFDFVIRIERLMAMLYGISVPQGCRRTCLVAVAGNSVDNPIFIGNEDCKIGGLDSRVSLNKGYVAGILTVDTVADFLPKKGPLRQRRQGIAYISNVAVREKFRRKGIAKRLVSKAVDQARSWGCRAVALHCDINNPGAIKLYMDQGFRSIKVPQGANWPQPRTNTEVQFAFMMKLLNNPTTA